MGKFSLGLLDKYALSLSGNQVNKLYEAKTGKKYQKHLNEEKHYYSIYLDEYTISNELDKTKMEFATDLNESHKNIFNEVFYKIIDEGIIFKTEDENKYNELKETFISMGIDADSIQ